MTEDLDAYETLKTLVEQIAMSEFRDELGHRLKMNSAYRDAPALVLIREKKPPSLS